MNFNAKSLMARPRKDQVKQAYELSGLTLEQFARLSYCSEKTAQDWIDGTAIMHRAFWELTGIKLAEMMKEKKSA